MYNILVLTFWRRNYMSHRQNIGTLERLKQYCNINFYDRENIELHKYNDLVEKHNPDIVICYGAMGFTEMDKPFKSIKRCKICIEPDYHNFIGKEDWYRNNGFDYLFLRNANDTSKAGIPSVWWPWSADQNEFFPDNRKRRNIIGFAGSSVHELYVIRRKARDILLSNNLLEDKKKTIMASEMSEGMWKGEWSDQGKYQKYLRSIKAILTSTENNGPFAKTFEAMSSETAILSSPIINKDLLFGNKQCYFEYKNNCGDVIEKANEILNNPELVKEVVMNAKEQFLEKHTTEIRVKELYDNLKRILESKEPIKKWGL
jgi:glycosyltransferase involved in cell wall biosynthesis